MAMDLFPVQLSLRLRSPVCQRLWTWAGTVLLLCLWSGNRQFSYDQVYRLGEYWLSALHSRVFILYSGIKPLGVFPSLVCDYQCAGSGSADLDHPWMHASQKEPAKPATISFSTCSLTVLKHL